METTLDYIKNTYAQEQGYEDWDDLFHAHIHHLLYFELVMNEVCIRAQKAALEKAAETAKIVMKMGDNFIDENYDMEKDELNLNSGGLVNAKLFVDRTSITNPENLIR